MEALGVLASGIAHDFNNMLTIIAGYSDLLISHMGDEKPLINEVQAIKQASDRAAVEHARDMLRRMIGEDIHLEIDLQPGLHCIQTDPGQLDQALVNLIANARDAMPEGGRLRIETAVLALDRPLANHFLDFAPAEYVRLRVADSGKGIDDDDGLKRIFEPFYTTKDSGKGSGLGLSMVYSLVDQSNGQIDVTSRASEGTAFDLCFPLTDTRPAEAAVAQASPAVGEDINQSGEIILLVEDDDVVRNLARRVLGDHGYSVVEARHGEEALAMSELHKGPIFPCSTCRATPTTRSCATACRRTK